MLTDAEERELEAIVARGFWAPRTSSASGRFIPQPNDAARYHELTEKWVKKQMEKPND